MAGLKVFKNGGKTTHVTLSLDVKEFTTIVSAIWYSMEQNENAGACHALLVSMMDREVISF